MMKKIIIVLITIAITGCTYYQPAPAYYPLTSSIAKFDRSWSAATGALADQGVRITAQDRGAGIVQGNRNGIDVTANIRTQADGGIRVEFNTSGATKSDPLLIQRINHSYSSRMGR